MTGVPTSSAVDPFSDAVLDDPYPMHAALREAGPAVRLERYGVYALARHDDVAAALRDETTYCSGRGVGLADFAHEEPWRPQSLLLEADPPDHTAARRVVTGVLTRSAMGAMRALFDERAAEVADQVVAAGAIDGVHDVAHAFPLSVFPDAMGLPDWGREALLPYGCMVFNGFGPRNGHFERAMKQGAEARDVIMSMTLRENLRPDGFGMQILEAGEAAGYSEGDASLIMRSVLSAGVDTTVHALGSALLCFADAPEQWDALRANPDRAEAAFEEVVRFESPVQTFFRTTTTDTDVDGVTIPEGSKVLLFFASANRDPRRWEDPDTFDVMRRVTGHVGFGNGAHACVGRLLARLEGECMLAALAERVTRFERSGPVVRQLNNTLRGLDALPLRVHA
jgi:cytochrome P450